MKERRTRVYVAGPLTLGDPIRNVRAAVDAATALLERGYAPFVPHLNEFWHFAAAQTEATWLAWDFEWLAACDVLLRLPGVSVGADQEVALATELGIPVYYSLDSLCATVAPNRGPSMSFLDWIIHDVKAELLRARTQYDPFTSAHEGFAVLKEEVDELWDDVRLKQSDPARKERIRHEAIQVAAMAVRIIHDCCK